MHEATIAQSVLEAISAEAKKQKARPIAAKISCGVLSGINNETLRFAFEAISKDTVCENLKLNIRAKADKGQMQKMQRDLRSLTCTSQNARSAGMMISSCCPTPRFCLKK